MWISYLSWRWRSVTKCGRHNFLSDFTFQLLKNASMAHVLFVFVWNVFTNTDNRKNVKEQSMRQTIDIAIK